MPWVKGQSGNPKGRAKKGNTYLDQLHAAIKTVEKRKKKKLLIHFVERAYEDPVVLGHLLKKLIPDQKFVEGQVRGELIVKLMQYGNRDSS